MTPRRALLAAAFLPATAAAAAAQDEPALLRLMAALASVRERRAAFSEERELPELDQPLLSEGRLLWAAPDRLEKTTTWPIEERLTLAGRRLTYERPDRRIRRDFDLAEQPEMEALVEAVRATLAGDLAALRRHYEVAFAAEGTGGRWRIALLPLSLRVRGAVQRISVAGEGAELRSVVTEGNGATTRMRVTPAP